MENFVKFFNQSPIKSLATVDAIGNPNICLCGSALMIDEKTIQVLYGYIHKSFENLKQNRAAVFLASSVITTSFWKHYDETGEKLFIPGYRYDCTFKEELFDKNLISKGQKRLLPIIGTRAVDGFKSLLVFNVIGVREINFQKY